MNIIITNTRGTKVAHTKNSILLQSKHQALYKQFTKRRCHLRYLPWTNHLTTLTPTTKMVAWAADAEEWFSNVSELLYIYIIQRACISKEYYKPLIASIDNYGQLHLKRWDEECLILLTGSCLVFKLWRFGYPFESPLKAEAIKVWLNPRNHV